MWALQMKKASELYVKQQQQKQQPKNNAISSIEHLKFFCVQVGFTARDFPE